MGAGHFTTVFDIAVSGYKDWQFPAFGLIFVVVGAIIFFVPAIIKRMDWPFLDFPSTSFVLFRYAFLGFALLWTAGAFLTTYGVYSRHHDLAARKACTVVEGQVTGFVAMPYSGHGDESFSVSGVQFHYSDFGVSDAFNNTSSHGGPLDKNAYVRICYDPSDNAILELEIRDFKGAPRDYSRGDDLFSDTDGNPQEEPPNLLGAKAAGQFGWQWLADLWVVLYFADVLAVVVMFVPYLRTFWRMKTLPFDGPALPRWLEPGQKTKLRNSLVYWDIDGSAVWLRARGFNFFRVAGAIAKLNVNETSRAIANAEIRYSSGLVLVLVLFFVTAFLMFSTAVPGNSSGPAIAIGVFFVMFLVSAFIRRKRLISRMEMLVQDALEELGRSRV